MTKKVTEPEAPSLIVKAILLSLALWAKVIFNQDLNGIILRGFPEDVISFFDLRQFEVVGNELFRVNLLSF